MRMRESITQFETAFEQEAAAYLAKLADVWNVEELEVGCGTTRELALIRTVLFVPPSMLVIGGGATGVQVASIFNAFGSKVQLFQAGTRILPYEDEDVSAAVAAAFRESGIKITEGFGTIESFEESPGGVRMIF